MSSTLFFILLVNSVALGMNLFVIAAGLTLIFGVLRIVNFAHGAFYMIGAYVSYTLIQQLGTSDLGFWAGVIGGGLAMGLIAFVIERLLLSRLSDGDHMLQLLFTFGLVLIIKDVTKLVWGTDQFSIASPPMFRGAVNLGFSYYPAYMLLLCGIGPIIALALWYATEKTRWGRIFRAAESDREMLGALGINVKMVYSAVFVCGSILAAMGGALAAPRSAIDLGMDSLVIIDCFVIVIIGGLGSLKGSFVGALILGFLTVFGMVFLQEWSIVLVYGVMIGILLFRPWGLFGQSAEERH